MNPPHDPTWPQISQWTEKENEFSCEMVFPPDYAYFDGHFDSMKLVPAVAQLDLLLQIVRKAFHWKIGTIKVSRVKFMHPIVPNLPTVLEGVLDPKNQSLSFHYFNPQTKSTFSSGKIKITQEFSHES